MWTWLIFHFLFNCLRYKQVQTKYKRPTVLIIIFDKVQRQIHIGLNFKRIIFRLLLNTCYIRLFSLYNVTYKEKTIKKSTVSLEFFILWYILHQNRKLYMFVSKSNKIIFGYDKINLINRFGKNMVCIIENYISKPIKKQNWFQFSLLLLININKLLSNTIQD